LYYDFEEYLLKKSLIDCNSSATLMDVISKGILNVRNR
jgi:hypothetical protein